MTSPDLAWPEEPSVGAQPAPGSHLLRLAAVEWRPAFGGKLAWDFDYVEVPSASRLKVFTRASADATSNATGLMTALNDGDYPSGLNPGSLVGRSVRAITAHKPNGHLTFRAVRPADQTNPFRFLWVGRATKKENQNRESD